MPEIRGRDVDSRQRASHMLLILVLDTMKVFQILWALQYDYAFIIVPLFLFCFVTDSHIPQVYLFCNQR